MQTLPMDVLAFLRAVALSREGYGIQTPTPNPHPRGESMGWNPLKNHGANWGEKLRTAQQNNYNALKDTIKSTNQQRENLFAKIIKNITKDLPKWHDYEETKLGLEDCGRCLHIASLNMDDSRAIETYNNLIIRLRRRKSILRIQETRNIVTRTYKYEDYTIHFSPSISHDRNEETHNARNIIETGRVAIEFHSSLAPIIINIRCINHRIMEIPLKTNLQGAKIHILHTYAPHMGFAAGEQVH